MAPSRQSDRPTTLGRVARYCALTPSGDAAFARRVHLMAVRAVELGGTDSELPWNLLARGITEFRVGDYSESAKTLELVLSAESRGEALKEPKTSPPLLALGAIFRALNAKALGQHAQAQSMADEIGRNWTKWGIPAPPPNFKQLATTKVFDVSDEDAAWLAYRERTEALAGAPRP